MYLLDTNVISEMRKLRTPRIDENVARWCDSVDATDLFLSVATLFELELGTLLVERRDAQQGRILRAWVQNFVRVAFAERTLAYTSEAAVRCAALNVPNRRPGNDGIIAATALAHGLTLVTRNVMDFDGTGVAMINPWLG